MLCHQQLSVVLRSLFYLSQLLQEQLEERDWEELERSLARQIQKETPDSPVSHRETLTT